MEHPEIIRVGWMKGNNLHNFLVFLYHTARAPLPLCAAAVALMALPAVLAFDNPLQATALMATAMATDLALLLMLPRRGISYGWVQPPWLLFSVGRTALALVVGLLPLSPLTALAALAAVQGSLTLLSWYGHLVEPFAVRQTRLRWEVPGLQAPLRLLLLTDLHVERLTRRERDLLATVRDEAPDLVLVGGDLLNLSFVGDPRAMAQARELLSQLSAPAGVYLVRGTWDVDPPHLVERMLDGLDNITPINGDRVMLEHHGAQLQLVGVPADIDPDQRDELLTELVRGAESAVPLLCLHHLPDLLERAAELGVQLYLAGHTHGGQICVPWLGPLFTGSRFGRRYVRGEHRVGPTRAYISRGVGLEGLGAPRMRFLAPPELVWIELCPAPAKDQGG